MQQPSERVKTSFFRSLAKTIMEELFELPLKTEN